MSASSLRWFAPRVRLPRTVSLPLTNTWRKQRIVQRTYERDMKLFLFSLLIALLATCAMAAAPKRTVLVTYPKGTPDEVVTKAMNKVMELVCPSHYCARFPTDSSTRTAKSLIGSVSFKRLILSYD